MMRSSICNNVLWPPIKHFCVKRQLDLVLLDPGIVKTLFQYVLGRDGVRDNISMSSKTVVWSCISYHVFVASVFVAKIIHEHIPLTLVTNMYFTSTKICMAHLIVAA